MAEWLAPHSSPGGSLEIDVRYENHCVLETELKDVQYAGPIKYCLVHNSSAIRVVEKLVVRYAIVENIDTLTLVAPFIELR